RHPALALCLSMIFFRKPVPTFRDHALTKNPTWNPIQAISMRSARGAMQESVPWTTARREGTTAANGRRAGSQLSELLEATGDSVETLEFRGQNAVDAGSTQEDASPIVVRGARRQLQSMRR